MGIEASEISAVVGSEFRNSYSDSSFLSPQSSFISLGSTRLSFESGGLGAIRFAEHPVRRVNPVLRSGSSPGGHSVFRSARLGDYIGLAIIYNDWVPPFDGLGTGDMGDASDGGHVIQPLPLTTGDGGWGLDSSYEPGEVVSEDGLPQDSVTFLEYNSDNESTGYDSN